MAVAHRVTIDLKVKELEQVNTWYMEVSSPVQIPDFEHSDRTVVFEC